MELNDKIMRLICDLEYIIGSECYNPSSYDGWSQSQGLDFRYPVWSIINDTRHQTNWKINNITPANLNTIHYKFGANHLYIGIALSKCLKHLEERYDIDFNELENNRKKEV